LKTLFIRHACLVFSGLDILDESVLDLTRIDVEDSWVFDLKG